MDQGNRTDTMYKISCDLCGQGVQFEPDALAFPQTSISIKNLWPGTSYRFVIYSENGVSGLDTKEPKSADIEVKTKHANPVLSKKVEVLEAKLAEREQDVMELKKIVKENRDMIRKLQTK